MATLQIEKEKALEMHKGADKKVKKALEDLLGADVFKGDIMDRVKTIEDACRETGKDYAVEFSDAVRAVLSEDEIGYREMKILYEALNEGWEADYSNVNQYKYYPWVKWVSGRGLSLCGVDCDSSDTSVGPRLVLKSEALAEYAFKQFPDTFKRFFNNKINK